MRAHGPWKILLSHQIYEDQWVSVRKDDVIRPDGAPGTHGVIAVKPGVTVLALDDDGVVHLTEEFHYAVGRVTLEAVSGGIDEGEEAPACARRELREELGIEAEELVDLGSVDPFTSTVVSPTRLFLARQLSFRASAPEGTELIRHVRLPLAEALERVMDGTITHSPTCVAIFKTRLLTR